MKLYDETFLSNLDDDPKVALFNICKQFTLARAAKRVGVEEHFEAYALIEAFVSANDLNIEIPELPEARDQRLSAILVFIHKMQQELTQYVQFDEEQRLIRGFRSEFSAYIEKSFVYEFSGGDIKRIQTLLNELRELVMGSSLFDEKHRRRLLKRVENLQKDLHKKQSDLDHFWGLVGDAGVAIGKFGKDAKPFVDRIKEITNIVWRTQSRAEELPSDSEPPALLTNDS